jgi:hypothetical protein
MGRTYRTYLPEQDFLLPPSLGDWLPEGYLAYFVSDVPSGPDLVRSPEICASGSEVPGFVFGILIMFFVIGISLAVQPDSSLANLPPAKRPGE